MLRKIEVLNDLLVTFVCIFSIIIITGKHNKDTIFVIGSQYVNPFTITYSSTLLILLLKYSGGLTLLYLQNSNLNHIAETRVRNIGKFVCSISCLMFSIFLASGLMTFTAYLSNNIYHPTHFYLWLYCLVYNTGELASTSIRLREFEPLYNVNGARVNVSRSNSQYNDLVRVNNQIPDDDSCILYEHYYNDHSDNNNNNESISININSPDIDQQQQQEHERPEQDEEKNYTNQCMCVICLAEFNINDKVVTLPCYHVYHTTCLIDWIVRSSSCPTCRAVLHERIFISQLEERENNEEKYDNMNNPQLQLAI